MWEKTEQRVYTGVKKEKMWLVLKNVNSWKQWNSELEESVMIDPFEKGGVFHLKHKKAPLVQLTLAEVIEGISFTDCLQLSGAKMFGRKEIVDHSEGVELKVTYWIEGLGAKFWVQMLGEKVKDSMISQMEGLMLYLEEESC